MTTNTQLDSILNEYGVSHQNPINQKIHKICVPLILWSLLGLLSQIPGPVNYAYVFVAFGLGYYVQFKNLRVYYVILGQIIPMFIAIYFLKEYDYRLWLGIFVLAWIGQFIGHKIEGKKPSFFQDIFFLMIGPVWILQRFVR